MNLQLDKIIIDRLKTELRNAGSREIGGLLFGEHLGGDYFRIVDFSVQTAGGTDAHFLRDLEQNQKAMDRFFASVSGDFERFNYIGEWHSHPSFSVRPSGKDIRTMRGLIDQAQDVNFLVLIIVRLDFGKHLALSANLFQKLSRPTPVSVVYSGIEKRKFSIQGLITKFWK